MVIEILRLLDERPNVTGDLERIHDYEKKHYQDPYFFTLGWQWDSFSPPISPPLLHLMHLRGILRRVYKSNSGTGYVTMHPKAIPEALMAVGVNQLEDAAPVTIPTAPADLFSSVIGYDDVKQQLRRTLDMGVRVNWLLYGPPASAKTLFLMELERIPGSYYLLGSRLTGPGLSDFLMGYRPRILLIDEIDKLRNRDVAPLLSLMETGRVIETMYQRYREDQLGTVVFAAANTVKGLSAELLSRFEQLYFSEYTREQFLNVSTNLLIMGGTPEDLARYIAEKVCSDLGTENVRQAVRVSRLCDNKADVDQLVDTLRKYRSRYRKR